MDANSTEDIGGGDMLTSSAIGSSEVPEASPDSLKNTPSNIAKLEDVIEHCEGRQKYLAHTRSPSDGGDVRWYFCKVPLLGTELAASVPKTEIVGKGDYFRFGMRDSLAIEASFLKREEELLSIWWKEYAECSEGPKERSGSSQRLDKQRHESASEVAKLVKLYDIEEERVGVPVKGGLYEVDLVKRHCFPVYWNAENRRVMRGHWFARKGGLDWLPIREDVAEQLEIAYRSRVWRRRAFQPSGLFASRVDLQGSTPGLHALFTGEDNTWEAWLNVDASGFSSVIALGGNGIKLRRGYSPSNSPKPTQDDLRQQKEEEMDDYCSQVPVRHLVFMVHGIGQRLEKSNLVDDVGNFRHITSSLGERHLTLHQRSTQRVLFIPCQWRKGLKLSGEAAVEKITLDGVKGLRVMLGATAHDVLYYMSPIYCQDIINSVSNQLNRLYMKFLRRNPGYDGKVSIYGHSLGSVLSYDILCHQENLSSPFPMDWMYAEPTRSEGFSGVDNKSSTRNSSCSTEDKSSTAAYGTADIVHFTKEDERNVHEMHLHLEDPSIFLDPVTSNSAELITTHENTSGGTEYDSSKRLPHTSDGLEEFKNWNCELEVPSVNKVAELQFEDSIDKDEAIKSLQEEVDYLKKKLAELELTSASRNGELNQGMPKEPISEELPPEQDDESKSFTPHIKYKKLAFQVDTFFAVGSPLGVFLALRNIRIGIGKGKEYWDEEIVNEEMPSCRQMFNIFHPFDPVAYRIEPLVCKEYMLKRPVIIPFHRGGRRLHIGFREFTDNLALRSQAMKDNLHTLGVKVLTVCQSRKADVLEEGADDLQEGELKSYGVAMMERLTRSEEGRIDHMLQDKTFEHPYLQAIKSHTNYWRDHDTALFILKHLYRDIPEDPDTPPEYTEPDSKDCWYSQRESIEEELTLTFSDETVVRSFSRKAKKMMKNQR
ncbi:phospholipase SGR2 isoform X2 [Momordica charantia]|uniref:Phospholipase SGR2 isoform X2 n=1 Tax=Momordica charantia TaxID=3673 RepID=A0A6J1DDX7_MOMCH|nr:phospholipase SGR2 isoform X2 [Momordica charantia]